MVVDLKKYRIGVLRGGPSSEREISLLSGESILEILEERGFEVIDIIVPERKDRQYLKSWILRVLKEEKVDVCFIALHGWFGEDGNIQKILDESSYLYTGSGEHACKISMDKIASKDVFESNLIPTPRYFIVDSKSRVDWSLLKFPVILKPSSQGSSIGVYKIKNSTEAESLIPEVLNYDGRVLVEDFIEGIELTVGIAEDKPLAVIKISPSGDIYNYEVKYTDGLSSYSIPADIDEGLTERVQSLALKAHRAMGCSMFSRVDMLYSIVEDEAYVLEVNTIPGFTKVSLLPKAAKASGIEFDELVLKMLESAFKEERCSRK
ncbi:MAG: D-alanine--D-alanine ligase [Candidatus Kaelpia aquatica]|nr:D-alanine--D-alanine ligase [Candidatus Kaelpia aquatica]